MSLNNILSLKIFILFSDSSVCVCCPQFQKDIEVETELVAGRRNTACEPKELYGIFLQKVRLPLSLSGDGS